jgi:hypothetical protein
VTGPLADRRLHVVWLALVAATGVSWLLGAGHGAGADSARAGTAIALGVAFVKVRYVGLEFMELRHAPPSLRWIFEGWVAVVGVTLITLYLTG